MKLVYHIALSFAAGLLGFQTRTIMRSAKAPNKARFLCTWPGRLHSAPALRTKCVGGEP